MSLGTDLVTNQETKESELMYGCESQTITTCNGEEITYEDILVPGGNKEVEPGTSSSRIVHIPRRPTPLGMRKAKTIYRLQTRKYYGKAQKPTSLA